MTDLKESSGTNLVIMGSGVLIGSLMAADLIDEYLLMIAALVLGTGRRLFAGGTHASLRLVDSITTSTGIGRHIRARSRIGDQDELLGPGSGRPPSAWLDEGGAHQRSEHEPVIGVRASGNPPAEASRDAERRRICPSTCKYLFAYCPVGCTKEKSWSR